MARNVVTKMQRVEEVARMLVQGYTLKEIEKASKKNKWNIQQRQLVNYVKEARDLIYKAHEYDREYELGLALSRLNDLYNVSYQAGRHQTALLVQREINAILGLNLGAEVLEKLQKLDIFINAMQINLLSTNGTKTLEQDN